MRRTITISVSEEMLTLIGKGTRARCCSSISEYVRFLVRRDQKPDAVKQEPRAPRRLRTANEIMQDTGSMFDDEH